jgi:glycosyltransferase involved in cell wall biosynthesis
MRIAFLLHQGNMYSGGLGVYTYELTRELAELGNDVHIIAGPPYPDVPAGVSLYKVRNYSIYRLMETGRIFFYGREPMSFFHPLNFGEMASSRFGMFSVMGAFSFRAYFKLRELASSMRFDIAHDVQGLGYGDLLMKANGLPVVTTIHHPLQVDRVNSIRQMKTIGDKVKWAKFYPFFMQEIVAKQMDRIITGSHNAAESVGREFHLQPGAITVIYDGVDVDMFRPLETKREKGKILFVGNSDDRNKGAQYLLEALARLQHTRDFHLTVVDRDIAWLVPALTRKFGLSSRVHVTGRISREELVQHYNTCELLVSPSLYEGFGLPAAEAMACGTPVIATTAGAFPEVIEDGVSGILVAPGDSEALASVMERVLDDADLQRQLGREGRRRIVDRFSWRQTAVQTLALYQEVLSGRRNER